MVVLLKRKIKIKLSGKELLKKNIENTLVHIGTLILELQRVQNELKKILENIDQAIIKFEEKLNKKIEEKNNANKQN
jgi:hypothetical protein